MSRLVNAVSRRIPRMPRAIWQDFPVHSTVCWFTKDVSTGALLYEWTTDGGSTSISDVFSNATVVIDATGTKLGSNAAPVAFSFYFTGGDVIQSDIIGRFDRFFLHSVTAKITPVFSSVGTAGAQPVVDCYAVPDYDGVDGTTASVGLVQGRPTAVKETWNPTGSIARPLVCTVKPQLTTAVYGGALTSAYSNQRAWVSTNYYNGSGAAQHYGLKVVGSQFQFPAGMADPPVQGLRFEFSYRIGLREMLGGNAV